MKKFINNIQTNPENALNLYNNYTKLTQSFTRPLIRGSSMHKYTRIPQGVTNLEIKPKKENIYSQQDLINQLDNQNLMKNINNKKRINQNHKNNILELKQNSRHNNDAILNIYKDLEPQSIIIDTVTNLYNNKKIIWKALKGKLLQEATIYQNSFNQKQKKRIFPLLIKNGGKLSNYEDTTFSNQSHGIITSFAANTNRGITRNYNEDRFSICLDISKGNTTCSFFAIYDGHGGSSCCNYLVSHLHKNILNNEKFPQNIRQAIEKGIKNTEDQFLSLMKNKYNKQNILDKSGSCAIIALIVENEIYIINIGDSRAILSSENGKFSHNLSRDHKPNDIYQQKRIYESGGAIYRTQIYSDNDNQQIGPLRVIPGRLSVCRTFGDIEAKYDKLGGNDKVVIANPQIKHLEIKQNHDFIILGSDGIYDKLDSREIVQLVWMTVQNYRGKQINIHQLCKDCVEQILREAMNRRSIDNITIVMITFKSFQNKIMQIIKKAGMKSNDNIGNL